MKDDVIYRQQAIDALLAHFTPRNNGDGTMTVFVLSNWTIQDILSKLPSAQPEWNNHTVACLLADMFGDACACNYNGIDEWLPGKCELLDSCPHPVGVACWEQFLKHKAERRTDGRCGL